MKTNCIFLCQNHTAKIWSCTNFSHTIADRFLVNSTPVFFAYCVAEAAILILYREITILAGRVGKPL